MGEVSRRWMWVESMGVASGCGCKEVYIDFLILLIPTPLVSVLFLFPHITYPYSSCICSFLISSYYLSYSSCICSFLQQHPYFLFI